MDEGFYSRVEKCLDAAVLHYRARVLRYRLRDYVMPYGEGFSIYLSLVHPPTDIAPPLRELLRYIDALLEAKLPGLEVYRWFKTLALESYEAGGPRFVYPMIYIILEGKPCRNWMRGGCIMCGYNLTKAKLADPCTGWRNFLASSYFKFLKYPGAPLFMVSTRGSFFDEWEISSECRLRILGQMIHEFGKYVHTETRGDVVVENYESVRALAESLDNPEMVSVGVGVESVFEEVLRCAVNKHESPSIVLEGVDKLKRLRFYTMMYLFTPKPLLTLEESLYDLRETVRVAEEKVGPLPFIVFPLGIHRASLVEYLYLRGRIKPPSLVEFARMLYSLPDSVLRYITNLQHVPTIPGPVPLVPNVDIEKTPLQDIIDIHLFAATGDRYYLEKIMERYRLEPYDIPEKTPWRPGEICQRALQLCQEVLEFTRRKDLGRPLNAPESRVSLTTT